MKIHNMDHNSRTDFITSWVRAEPTGGAAIIGICMNLCGSLCSMNDIIAKQVELPAISVGDVLCFENTGAYCMTEGISLFLSRDIPAVYLIGEDGRISCARKPFETYVLNTIH